MGRSESESDDDGFGEASRYTAHLDRGWSLLDRGDNQRARSSAQQALELRPEIPDAAMLMAAICLATNDPEGAVHWYERAIDADAEYVDAQLAAAQVLLYDLDQPERALARAMQGRELDEATVADLLDFALLEAEALITLGDRRGAGQRLAEQPELWILEELLDRETERERLAELLQQFAGDPWELEPEDAEQLMARVVSLALRVARTYIEVGAPNESLAWIETLLQRFAEEPDVWYLCNEAAYFAGDPVRAAQAALQVLQLDARAPLPAHAPTSSELHAKVVQLLLECNVHDLRELARDPNFIVLVNDAPAVELVLEGVDPRARVLALAARSARETDPQLTLTGVAIYRRNLGRLGRDATIEQELAFALFDELSMFFAFDDARRAQLGLPIGERPLALESRPRAREIEQASAPIEDPTAEQAPAKSKRGAKRKAKSGASKAKPTAKAKPAVAKPKPAVAKPAVAKPKPAVAKTKPAKPKSKRKVKVKVAVDVKPAPAESKPDKPATTRKPKEPIEE